MKIPYQQNTKSGCGSYTLANFFNDESYIAHVHDLEAGEGTYELNETLRGKGQELFLDSIFITHSQCQIQQNRLHDPMIFETVMEKVSDDERLHWARPFFVTIKGLVRNHYVLALHNLKDQMIYLFDSLRQQRE